MEAPKANFSDLEERFSKDAGKAELASVTARVDGHIAEVKKLLDGGVSPSDFRSLSRYREALEAAAACLPAIWASCQPK
jgi:hypothetical protein